MVMDYDFGKETPAPPTPEVKIGMGYKDSFELEGVNIPSEPSRMYSDMLPGKDTIPLKDLTLVIQGKIGRAFKEGHFHETIGHYAQALEKAGAMLPDDLATFKSLSREAFRNRFDEKASEITLKKTRELLNGLKPMKRRQ
jgi:hypothetical protein